MEIDYGRLDALETLLGGRAAINDAYRQGKTFGTPDAVASEPTTFVAREPYYATVYSGVTVPRAALALRFDDAHPSDQTLVKPALDARLLPAGFAIPRGFLDQPGFLTTAQILQMEADGHEILAHSRLHLDPTVNGGYPNFYDEAIVAADELRGLGVFIQNFVQPGTWTGAYYFDTLTKLKGAVGRELRNAFAVVEGYSAEDVGGVFGLSPIPARYRYGASLSNTGTNPGVTLAAIQGWVDELIRYGGLFEILIHSYSIGNSGVISSSNFTAFLDYVQSKRDAGLLDVVTPTSLRFAQIGPYRANLLTDGSLENQPLGNLPTVLPVTNGWYTGSAASVVDAVGRPNAYGFPGRCGQIAQGSALVQDLPTKDTVRSLRVDGWFRNAASSSTVTARLTVNAMQSGNSTPLFTKQVTASVGQTYTQLSALVGTHPNVDYWQIRADLSGSGVGYADDLSVVKL